MVAIAPPVALDVIDEVTSVQSTDASERTMAVVEQYQTMVYAICLTHTRSRVDADDVFQEVFLTFHRKQPVCTGEEHRKAWLITTTLTIAKRVSLNSWHTRVVPVDGVPDRGETWVFDDPRQDALFRALAGLPETYRSVIHLFYFEDCPVSQISAVLGLTPGTVKMRLSRGRTLLREAMTKEDSHV